MITEDMDGPPTPKLRRTEGEMAEWSNAAVSKTVVPLPRDRGFESPSLRNDNDFLRLLAEDFCFKEGRTKLVLLRSDLKQKPNE